MTRRNVSPRKTAMLVLVIASMLLAGCGTVAEEFSGTTPDDTDTSTEIETTDTGAEPDESPTESPTATATSTDTATGTATESDTPTESPTASPSPTDSPTPAPTSTPTPTETENPTENPPANPTESPTSTESPTPTASPTPSPTATASPTPSPTPTPTPTASPGLTPTEIPSDDSAEGERVRPSDELTVGTGTAVMFEAETETDGLGLWTVYERTADGWEPDGDSVRAAGMSAHFPTAYQFETGLTSHIYRFDEPGTYRVEEWTAGNWTVHVEDDGPGPVTYETGSDERTVVRDNETTFAVEPEGGEGPYRVIWFVGWAEYVETIDEGVTDRAEMEFVWREQAETLRPFVADSENRVAVAENDNLWNVTVVSGDE